MLPLHHAPSIFQGAEYERTRSQYAGKPATGSLGLCFAATRVMLAGTQKTACISTWRHRLRSRELESGQLRPRLRLGPVGPRRDVLELRLEAVTQGRPPRIWPLGADPGCR